MTDFTLNLIIQTLCSASLGFHCAYVNGIKSPQMSVWFNFFHSGRQLNWISPKWLSISCLCVTSGAGCWGIQTHSPIYLTPISHLAQSVRLSIFQKHKSCNVIEEWALFLHASSYVLIDCFKNTFVFVCAAMPDFVWWIFMFLCVRILLLCLTRKAHSVPKIWHCS